MRWARFIAAAGSISSARSYVKSSCEFHFHRYLISIGFFLFIIYDLLVTCVQSSKQNAALNSKYTKLAGYLIILWIAYPIVWVLAEGQEIISVNAEVGSPFTGL